MKVVSQGWDPQSRTVHGEHFNYHIIGKQNTCNFCKEIAMTRKGKKGANAFYKFASWHPGVLKRLPRDLVELFPAVILRKAAIDTKLITRIEQTLVSPIGLQTLEKQVAECHKGYFMKMQIRCAQLVRGCEFQLVNVLVCGDVGCSMTPTCKQSVIGATRCKPKKPLYTRRL